MNTIAVIVIISLLVSIALLLIIYIIQDERVEYKDLDFYINQPVYILYKDKIEKGRILYIKIYEQITYYCIYLDNYDIQKDKTKKEIVADLKDKCNLL